MKKMYSILLFFFFIMLNANCQELNKNTPIVNLPFNPPDLIGSDKTKIPSQATDNEDYHDAINKGIAENTKNSANDFRVVPSKFKNLSGRYPVYIPPVKSVQENHRNLFEAPDCIKNANSFLGEYKSKIISDYGTNYFSQQSTDGLSISYQNKIMKDINPVMVTFIFTSNDNKCSGVSMYFDFMQIDDVVSFMNKNFESKTPPAGVQVSFFKAWMQNKNNKMFIWKLTKTDKLFFLTIKPLRS